MMESIAGGKASGAERRADYVYQSREDALYAAEDSRKAGLRAIVRVVKTRRGKPQAWGVFLTLPQGQKEG